MDEADFCFSSLLLTCAVAAVCALLLLSGLSISLLCARVRRQDKGGSETARDVVHTLRSPPSFGRMKLNGRKLLDVLASFTKLVDDVFSYNLFQIWSVHTL